MHVCMSATGKQLRVWVKLSSEHFFRNKVDLGVVHLLEFLFRVPLEWGLFRAKRIGVKNVKLV